MDIREQNKRAIDARIEAGLAQLRERFEVVECEVDPALANPVIGGRPHHAQRYDIAGVGNLLVMSVKDADQAQLSSFVITPYAKDLPLFSTDYVYMGDKRFFLIEIYDLAALRGEAYEYGIESFARLSGAWSDMPDMPTQPRWYDDVRPVCISKAPGVDQDELAIQCFLEALRLFMDFADSMPLLSEEDRKAKWRANKDYADRLIDAGGVSTDLFTQALGPENTRRFFDEVFFGCACYR